MSRDSDIPKTKQELLLMLKEVALKKGDFLLSSGRHSNYYLDCRLVTLNPQGAFLAAGLLLEYIQKEKFTAAGGPTLGADPLVGAVGVLAYQRQIPLKTFIVRKAAKGHGMQQQIEGPPLEKADKVLLIDDVATTGKAIWEAKEALVKSGIAVYHAWVIVDREEGAKENLLSHGITLSSLFSIRELGV